jgi:predicted esterase YcpF (UPF0227 family)
MTEIVYLHGFNSAFDPENEKVAALSQLGAVHGISYDSYSSYRCIRRHLIDEIGKIECDFGDLLLVGTSLGGFWAAEMAAVFGCPSVIINPCYDPTEMLRRHIGENINYKTQEKKIFTTESCESYENIRIQDTLPPYFPLVLIDLGDTIIDPYLSAEIFEELKWSVIKYEGGSHRFDHMVESIEEIKKYLNYCSFVE